MTSCPKTLLALDRLIAKLQANTGGEASLPQEKSTTSEAKTDNKKKQQPKANVEVKPEKVQNEENQAPKKKKEEGAKPQKKKGGQDSKLPQGADPDILIFSGVDLRVSQIVECWKHPQSDYLFCEKIQVGKELRQIASGLQDHYKLEQMKGICVVMANLKPRSLGGFESNGMVVCASDKDDKSFDILRPQGPVGERLYLEGYEELFNTGEEILPVMNKKNLERCLKHFHTDSEGYVIWKDIKVRTKAGYIKSKFTNGNVS